jgi:hypothetical protein
LFRLEPVVQDHSLRAAARNIDFVGVPADLVRSRRRFGRLKGWHTLMAFVAFSFWPFHLVDFLLFTVKGTKPGRRSRWFAAMLACIFSRNESCA